MKVVMVSLQRLQGWRDARPGLCQSPRRAGLVLCPLSFVLLFAFFLLPGRLGAEPYNTPTVDGLIQAAPEDWDEGDEQLSNLDNPEGDEGDLRSLYVTWDSDSLYIGTGGFIGVASEGGTYRLGLVIDVDPGAGTGLQDLTSKKMGGAWMFWYINAPGFGGDFATYSLTTGFCALGRISTGIFRQVSEVNTAASWEGTHEGSAQEIAIPWEALYEEAEQTVPPGAQISFTAALFRRDTQPRMTEDILPSKDEQGPGYSIQGDTLYTDTVLTMTIDEDGDGVPDNIKNIVGYVYLADFLEEPLGDRFPLTARDDGDTTGPDYPPVTVKVTDIDDPMAPSTSTTSGKDGRYEAARVAIDHWHRIDFARTGYVSRSIDSLLVDTTDPIPAPPETLYPYSGAIRGTVYPDSVIVRVEGYLGEELFAADTTNGEDGRYILTNLSDGNYWVVAIPQEAGFREAAYPDSVEVQQGETTSGIDIVLEETGSWRDPVGDDHGPTHKEDSAGNRVYMDYGGRYVYKHGTPVPEDEIPSLKPVDGLYYTPPTSAAFPEGCHDLERFTVQLNGNKVEFGVTVVSLPDPDQKVPYDYCGQGWCDSPFIDPGAKILLPKIDIYIDSEGGGSVKGLPWRTHDIHAWDAWEYAIVACGWYKAVVHSNGASIVDFYTVFKRSADIVLDTNLDARQIIITVDKSLLGNPATEEDVREWDILVVMTGHDAGDDDADLGVTRWVEAGSPSEWRFGGGRSGTPGTWDGKQDPNVIDFLPIPGRYKDLPDLLPGVMMDYTDSMRQERIKTDDYPVRLAATRFEDREPPELTYAVYFAFAGGTSSQPDWNLRGYEDVESVPGAYGSGETAIWSDQVGSYFYKTIDISLANWYDISVRQIAQEQTMRLMVARGDTLCPDVTDTLDHQGGPSGEWDDETWGSFYLTPGPSTFQFDFLSGVEDFEDGLTLTPGSPPSGRLPHRGSAEQRSLTRLATSVTDGQRQESTNAQLAAIGDAGYLTIWSILRDDMEAIDPTGGYVQGWIYWDTAEGEAVVYDSTAMGRAGETEFWVADVIVPSEVDTLHYYFRVKDNAGPHNPPPQVDNEAVYPWFRPGAVLTPGMRDSLIAEGYPEEDLQYHGRIVRADGFHNSRFDWLRDPVIILCPEGTMVQLPRSAVAKDVAGVTVTLSVLPADEADPARTIRPGEVTPIGVVREIGIYDAYSEAPMFDFNDYVDIVMHYNPEVLNLAGLREDRFKVYRYIEATDKWAYVGGKVNERGNTIAFRTQYPTGRFAIFEDRSLERSQEKVITGLRFEPNPFSPNGDGLYDYLRISFYLWRDATVNIDIFDVEGEKVKEYEFRAFDSKGETLGYEWDGRDDDGEYVPFGLYLVRFRATIATEEVFRAIKGVAVVR